MSITAAQTETSVSLKFMAFVLDDVSEMHVWDISSVKARCLARLKPSDLLKLSNKDDETQARAPQFTCIRFSASQVSLLLNSQNWWKSTPKLLKSNPYLEANHHFVCHRSTS